MNMNQFWMGDLSSYLDTKDRLSELNQARLDGKISDEIVNQPMFLNPFDDEEDEDDDPYSEVDYMVEIQDDVAILNIEGSILSNSSWLTRWLGIPTHQDIAYAAGRLDADPAVKEIVVNLNTPGGSAMGIDEGGKALTAVMTNGQTGIRAHTSGMAASAGIWYATSVKDFTATKMALVGSIGVIQVHMEISKQLKAEGIEVHVFREGKYKALMNSFEPLTELAIEENNKKMKFLNDQFIAQVSLGRNASEADVRENMAEGREFFGMEAVKIGLVDSLSTMEQVVKGVKDTHNSGEFNSGAEGGVKMGLINSNDNSESDEDKDLESSAETDEEGVENEDTSIESEEGTNDEESSSDEPTDVSSEPEEDEDEEETSEGSLEEMSSDPVETKDAVLDVVMKLSKENESLKQQLSIATAEDESNDAVMLGLTKACMLAVARMEIALGVGASTLDETIPSAVLQTFHNLNTKYTTQFKTSAIAETETEEDDERDTSAQAETSVAISRRGVTQFV